MTPIPFFPLLNPKWLDSPTNPMPTTAFFIKSLAIWPLQPRIDHFRYRRRTNFVMESDRLIITHQTSLLQWMLTENVQFRQSYYLGPFGLRLCISQMSLWIHSATHSVFVINFSHAKEESTWNCNCQSQFKKNEIRKSNSTNRIFLQAKKVINALVYKADLREAIECHRGQFRCDVVHNNLNITKTPPPGRFWYRLCGLCALWTILARDASNILFFYVSKRQ